MGNFLSSLCCCLRPKPPPQPKTVERPPTVSPAEAVVTGNEAQPADVEGASSRPPNELENEPDIPSTGVQLPGLPPQVRGFDPKRTFVVTVGINEYVDPKIKKLNGAVADAEAVEQFLITTLGVPPNHIKSLRNKEATRDNIKKAILYLASDARIQENDPIIIYYAGHGSQAKRPEKWGSTDKNNDVLSLVQMLLPHDFESNPQSPLSTIGQGITDRTLSGLLRLVADVKGDNIVVILDSCHSSSGTRSVSSENEIEEMVYRDVELPADYRIDPNIDDDLSEKGSHKTYKYEEMESHILLAACGKEEKAGEHGNRGNFTSKLVEYLSKLHRDEGLEKTSYDDLILELPPLKNWEVQHPRCEGTPTKRLRALFTTFKSPPKSRLFHVTFKGETPYIDAGKSSPITTGAVFKIMNGVREICTARVNNPGVFQSPLIPYTKLDPSVAYGAELTEKGRREYCLSVFVEPDLLQELEAHESKEIEGSLSKTLPDIAFTSRIEKANIAVVVENTSIHLRFLNLPSMQKFRLEKTISCQDTSISKIISILEAASHFFFHLEHFGVKDSDPPVSNVLAHKIGVECYRVIDDSDAREYYGDEAYIRKRDGPNLHQNRVIRVSGTSNASAPYLYGFRVIKNLNDTVYLSVFFFSASDLTIYCGHRPPPNSGESPCLELQQEVHIGYDDTTLEPIEFDMPLGWKNDLGFMKLFLSTQKVDLSEMEREKSPFEDEPGTVSRGDVQARSKAEIWGGFWIPIVVTAA